jgi:hypothetical protein
MNRILLDTQIGRKNIVFGIALFLIFGVMIGTPLTIDFFGGSIFTVEQYQTWKVIHGYSIFLGFINYFFGLLIDRVELTRQPREIASWSILIAGVFGGVARGALNLFSVLHEYGMYASLGEVAFISLGTILFLRGLMKQRFTQSVNRMDVPGQRRAKDTLSDLASDASSK